MPEALPDRGPFRKIVVGVDFSRESEIAVAQALWLARSTGAAVALVHVEATLATLRADRGGFEAFPPAFVLALARGADRNRLEAIRDELIACGIAATSISCEGPPDTALAAVAAEHGADLVIVGTHGRTGVKRLLLGSVAEKTVRLSDRAVLVVRPRAGGDDGFRRILVPTDFSPNADTALAAAIRLAAPGARIDVLHCWWMPWVAAEAPIDMTAGLREAADAGGRELLARVPAELGLDVRFEAICAPPTAGILDRVHDGDAYDLVVMGSHGHRGVRRFVLGSVAEATVRHAPCSVLAVHLPAVP
jgi:nucleotide-binding universal stress UspA family protein